MKHFFSLYQNNSGGSWEYPAVNVIIEADNIEQARERAGRLITFCGDSGRYAEYDNCDCCPCCGHRWNDFWDDKPENNVELISRVEKEGLSYMGYSPATALLKADGTLLLGKDETKTITDYIAS